jgi:hypothetical protein
MKNVAGTPFLSRMGAAISNCCRSPSSKLRNIGPARQWDVALEMLDQRVERDRTERLQQQIEIRFELASGTVAIQMTGMRDILTVGDEMVGGQEGPRAIAKAEMGRCASTSSVEMWRVLSHHLVRPMLYSPLVVHPGDRFENRQGRLPVPAKNLTHHSREGSPLRRRLSA